MTPHYPYPSTALFAVVAITVTEFAAQYLLSWFAAPPGSQLFLLLFMMALPMVIWLAVAFHALVLKSVYKWRGLLSFVAALIALNGLTVVFVRSFGLVAFNRVTASVCRTAWELVDHSLGAGCLLRFFALLLVCNLAWLVAVGLVLFTARHSSRWLNGAGPIPTAQ